MALPMVHLLMAWEWAQDKPELRENPDYYLGAVSPDAIHVRDHDDKSHKNEIHLNNWRTPDPDAVLRYWTEHNTPFDIGYGIHVLLDGQWATEFRARFPEMLLPNGKPDPDIYLRGAAELGLPPGVCLALEDSPAGILSAYRAGCLPVLIPDQDCPGADTLSLLYAKADALADVIALLD